MRFYTEIAQWLAAHDWLRLVVLRHSEGIARYDYCGEARDYTKRWASDGDTALRIEVFGGLVGLADSFALVWARPALKRLRHRVRG